MFQESEIINLVLSLTGTFLFIVFSRGYRRPPFKLFYVAFLCILLAYSFTVLEGMFLPELFNLLEHFSLMVGGILFFVGCWTLTRKDMVHDG